MNALPKIEVLPVQRPIYRNTHVRDYGHWFAQNSQTLVNYWNELVTSDGAGPVGEDDFFFFCLLQHERELDQLEEYKRCYGSMRDTL